MRNVMLRALIGVSIIFSYYILVVFVWLTTLFLHSIITSGILRIKDNNWAIVPTRVAQEEFALLFWRQLHRLSHEHNLRVHSISFGSWRVLIKDHILCYFWLNDTR